MSMLGSELVKSSDSIARLEIVHGRADGNNGAGNVVAAVGAGGDGHQGPGGHLPVFGVT